MYKKFPLRQILGATILLSAFIGLSWQIISSHNESCLSKPVFSRNVEDLNGFEEMWSLDDIFLVAGVRAIYLFPVKDNVGVYGSLHACRDAHIILANGNNGKILHSEPSSIMPPNFGIYHVAYNDSFIYFGYDGLGQVTTDSTVNAGGVAAYDVSSGAIVWTRTIPGTRSMNSLAASEKVVAVDGGGFSRQFYLLDSQTGEVIQIVERDDPSVTNLGFQTNYALWNIYASSSGEVKIQSDDLQRMRLWAGLFEGVEQPPVLVNSAILVRTNSGTSIGAIKAFDVDSGNLLWKTDSNVISNVAATNSTAFFVTASAELIAIEIESGQKIGSVQFSDQYLQQKADRGFFVAASEESVFVYLGDSRQLFAFSFLAW